MRFTTLFWLIPEVITILLVLAVFAGMWIEEDFSWKFVFLLASVIAMGYRAFKNIKKLLAEDKQYNPEI